MQKLKQAAVAGLFYPNDPEQLKQDVNRYLDEAKVPEDSCPKALIAPHAGYIYSGPIAGSAYALLRNINNPIEKVVIVAPAHRVAVAGIALSSATHFVTPLGAVPLDRTQLDRLASKPGFEVHDQAYADEHSIEVHLPFLQVSLGSFEIIPLLVGNADPILVGDTLAELWGGDETLIVISSDLSHYLDYQSAKEMDQEATTAIERMQPEGLTFHHACGRTGISGLLLAAKSRGLASHTLDVRNSGDTAGDKSRVVGYGAYAVF